ncbi:MAG: cyclase [Candidatus Binatia bacterium]|nr:MAG: cyclase [Candidatus Binatia bacterium]
MRRARIRRRLWLYVWLWLAVPPAFGFDEEKLLDLTYPFDENTVYWPTSLPFRLETVHEGKTAGGFYYAAKNFCAAEHGGTHMDAPAHFARGKRTAGEIPLRLLVGPAVVVDVRKKAEENPDYALRVEDLLGWEEQHGRIPRGAVVLLSSGWGSRWPDRARYLGSAEPGDTKNLHFPGFSVEAARWLVRERDIDAVGVDTASVDPGPSRDFPAHRVFAEAEKPVFENVANVDRLPPRGALFLAFPMKIREGTGAPARIVALLP